MKKVLFLSVIAMLAVSCKKESQSSKLVSAILAEQAKTRSAYTAAISGCSAKVMASDIAGLQVALMMSQGQICLQVIGEDVTSSLQGKGLCPSASKACLFKLSYAKVSLAISGGEALSKEEAVKLSSEVDLAFEKAEQEEKARTN